MTVNQMLLWAITCIGLLNFIHICLYIGGANIYDIMRIRRMARARRQDWQKPFNPHVTVLIPAHNEELGIIRTLETVSRSTYRNISIVVIDDASTDRTSELVREYVDQHSLKASAALIEKDGKYARQYSRPKNGTPPICLLTREKNGGKAAGLNYALQHAVQGGLTMTLDADSALDEHAIENAVRYFADDRVVGVAANVKIMQRNSVLGLLQKFEHMIGYRSKKFYTLANCEFVIGGVASTYRYDVLKQVGFYDTDSATEDIGLSMKITAALGNKDKRIVYADDVIARTEGVQTFKALMKQRYRWKLGTFQNLVKYRNLLLNRDKSYSRSLTLYRMPMAFISEFILAIQPILVGYLLILSFLSHSITPMVGGYLTVTCYVLWSLWPDQYYTRREKLLLSIYSPIMYFCFYLMDFVQISAIFKCLFNAKSFLKPSASHFTWTSPERVGGNA